MNCTLCNTLLEHQVDEEFYDCQRCRALVKNSKLYPDEVEEQSRYLNHNNDVNDPRYQKFTSPISDYILHHFKPGHQGLDFGSGTGPVISHLLKDYGYQVKQYDPYFSNFPELLEKKYDYIFACEVVEHFYLPQKEFQKLSTIINHGGSLVLMTQLYDDSINFSTWYYRKDPTHVFIYRRETFEYIAENFSFKSPLVNNRLIVLEKYC